MMKCIACAIGLALLLAAGHAVAQRPDAHARVAALVTQMTLPEKVAQMQDGAPAIPRLGVPAYDWWSEGLHGIARNGYATVFQQAIGLAASWDAPLLHAVGTVVSTEARAKFNEAGRGHAHGRYQGLTLWSPNINIFRDPHWGRGQETYGEDPYLSSHLAVAFVHGIQGDDPQHPRAIAPQRALLERAKASGKLLIVVLLSGSGVALDWAQQHADAILAAWYPGQAGATAIAQVLAGDYNPAGRLPVTFYRSTRDLPPYVSYAMQGRTYHYFDGKPLYPFGYGLSYTWFAHAAPTLSTATLKADGTLYVSAKVRNAGNRAGGEVVQFYLDYPPSPLAPRHAPVDFRRIHLAAGEHRLVHFTLAPRQLSSVGAAGARAVEPGRYRVFIGAGQPGNAVGAAASFSIDGREALAS